jgi:hypothetical protein
MLRVPSVDAEMPIGPEKSPDAPSATACAQRERSSGFAWETTPV